MRRTIAAPIRVQGVGLHSGTPVFMTVLPGSDGIAFTLGGIRTLALPRHISRTVLCTRLGPVSTVEHVMSAFGGLGITDVEVEVTAPEIPALDGSAAPLVALINGAGIRDIREDEQPRLSVPFEIVDGRQYIRVAAGSGLWSYTYDRGEQWPGRQTFSCTLPAGYAAQVAPARTFAARAEAKQALERGLGQGLDYRTALIIGPKGYDNAPRFSDEPARHKLLDLIGDMYLAGIPVEFLDVTAYRTGHTVSVRAAQRLHSLVEGSSQMR
ncbi:MULTISPECIES: UDP-3-O-acyl-N-acetylglucosamine deacetylase [unclassified Streptomyces]|uniref:UDP-3-O-acyl-N-acetylglucosamine deacetylase n=1 Tax=unclassified Streptomyces TaxID=2593676 RepID=UPI001F4901F8|nr:MULTISPECIES: UDP-3-O-acyl-N-acetylglucosamine deacetylase [unclassified Streptomyces]